MNIYILDTDPLYDEAFYQKYLGQLSKSRTDKAGTCRFRKDQNLSIGAGILLDCGLKEYGLREKDMLYELGRNGKPCFPSAPFIHFSLSHSGHYAMAVFSDWEVGCDIEQITSFDPKIPERFFCPEEYSYIMEASQEKEQAERFFRLWTLKESFLKAEGSGLSLSLNSFSFTLAGNDILFRQKTNSKSYYFREFTDICGYRCAVCSEAPIPDDLSIIRVDLSSS